MRRPERKGRGTAASRTQLAAGVLIALGCAGLAAPGCDVEPPPDASQDRTRSAPAPERSAEIAASPQHHGGNRLCSLYRQDCDEGHKCTLWENDGDGPVLPTICAELVAEPPAVGEACTVDTPDLSQIDSCDRGLFCGDVDVGSLVGTCRAWARGSQSNPICDDPTTVPWDMTSGGGAFLCVPACDPLAPDCGDGGCYPIDGGFICAGVAAVEPPEQGAPCEFVNECAAGTYCVAAEHYPGCDGAGCCAGYCDLDDPACPDGLVCEPAPARQADHPLTEHIGHCVGA